ncbi:MAG: methionyl-tRNA formyltransferase [Patescibacteria group bacterium]
MFKIIFLGTPDFAAIILEKLIKSLYKPIACLTQPDKKVKRKQKLNPPPVKILCQKHKIPVLQFEKIRDKKAILAIKNLKLDIIIVAAYGQILPKEILELPKFGCINIHASLLPKYRGASPIQYAILSGDKETGVTLIKMAEKMDAGPILAQKVQKIYNNDTALTLHNKLANLGTSLLLEILPKIFKKKIKPKLQDETKATYTKILKKEDGKINWQNSAQNIKRQTQAFTPWPGSYTYFRKNSIKILLKIKKVHILNFKVRCAKNANPGDLFKTTDKKLAVSCGQGSLILEKVQVEGKKEISGSDFLRGYPLIADLCE